MLRFLANFPPPPNSPARISLAWPLPGSQ
jgi:hypothetical protein